MVVHKNAAAKRQRRVQRRTEPAKVTRVDPLVMALALDMAGGDATRVRVLSPNEVLIRNK